MNFLIFTSALLSTAFAQRGFYAGVLPKGYPELHSRFRDTNGSDITVRVEDRLGDPESNPNIPVDARGDVNLVNRLNQWPRENQPFWLINSDHIERHRAGDNANRNDNEQALNTNINNQNVQSRLASDTRSNVNDRNIEIAAPRFGGNVGSGNGAVNDQRPKSYYAEKRSGNVR